MASWRVREFGFSFLVLLHILIAPSGPSLAAPKDDIARQIRFGAEMAKEGNWREAIFRWKRALAADPGNPRLHNNLAVAYESLGEYDKAEAEYQAALTSPDAPKEVRENHELFLKFYKRHKESEAEPSAAGENKPSAGGDAKPSAEDDAGVKNPGEKPDGEKPDGEKPDGAKYR